jgi:hypothetical protein
MTGPFVVLHEESVDAVADKTGRSPEELLRLLEAYAKDGIYKVKIPLDERPNYNFGGVSYYQ